MSEARPRMFDREYASVFGDACVVDAYRHRPPYPPETFAFLESLLDGEGTTSAVLDVGCGTGFVARPLAARVERIDAVDISPRMLEEARSLPGGRDPRIRWICAAAEDAPLHGPYAMITAGASLHWLDWDVVLPRFREALREKGFLVLIEEWAEAMPWDDESRPIFKRYTMNPHFTPYDMQTVSEHLERRDLFRRVGSHTTARVAWQQTVSQYVESFHARNGLSRDRMGSSANAFDAALTDLVARHCPDPEVTLHVGARLIWGIPLC